MNKLLLTTLFALLLLSACESNEYLLSGESETWTGKMKVTQIKEYDELNFELHYKGEKKESVGEISFLVEYNGGSFGSEDVTLEESYNLLSGSKCKGCSSLIEKEDITVTVQWNGKTEEFNLN